MKRIFISSVQKEFERERAAIKRMIESDPILKPHFNVFVFEIDAPASDKSTQQVYAIAHRNYASIGSIQVEVYSDRVEVISPGRLHRAITVAELYKKHESFATNPRIARAMYQVKYIETIGTGLTDLLKECKAKGLREPLLEEVSGRFRIVIWRPVPATNRGDNGGDNRGDNSFVGLPNEQRRICEILIENPRTAIRKIASTLDVRPRTVEKQIAALKTKGVLAREGGTRGFWKVTLRKNG